VPAGRGNTRGTSDILALLGVKASFAVLSMVEIKVKYISYGCKDFEDEISKWYSRILGVTSQ